MKRTLIHNAIIVNEGCATQGSLVIENGRIAEVLTHGKPLSAPCHETIDATGCYLLPGVIDDHVHFREPGYTHKADILSESTAAAAGGVTSIMDMPNTNPQTTTLEALDAKLDLLNRQCVVNHSCYYGATNDNFRDFARLPEHRVCGIKLFMGSSTGNMLVDNVESLIRIFTGTDRLIAAHCEDTRLIEKRLERYKYLFRHQPDIPVEKHSGIRNTDVCFNSSRLAVQLATDTQARLHLLHLSTAKEIGLLSRAPIGEKRITAEACIAHLLYKQTDYKRLGTRIKCNPAVKSRDNMEALRKAVNEGYIDVIATDHAPHLLSEKQGGATQAASGIPMIQFSLPAMLELVEQGVFSIETVVEKMCHAPARLFGIQERGYVREGYKADLVLVRPHTPYEVTPELILSKCGWSPLEGTTLHWKVEKTWANGHLIYTDGQVDTDYRGEELYIL